MFWYWYFDCLVEVDKNGIVLMKNLQGNLIFVLIEYGDWFVGVIEG